MHATTLPGAEETTTTLNKTPSINEPTRFKQTQSATSSPTPAPTLDLALLPETLPKSMKGYELVSWQTGKVWNFTLITGTNRIKTFEELISPESYISDDGLVKLTVSGVKAIKDILKRIPPGEFVSWGGMNLYGQVPSDTIYFSYPPQEIMDELFALAKENGFELFTLKEPE
jgi:hypothetical protein